MQDAKNILTRTTGYIAFIALSCSILYSVLVSWSAEALFLDPVSMPLYFVVTAFLFFIITSNDIPFSLGEKISLALIHAFLTRMVTIIFFYPGTSGDNAYHLAHERTFSIFGKYYMALAPEAPAEVQSLIGRLFVFQRGSIQYGLVTALSKTLYIDVFWIHLFLVATLWSLFVPIISFKIAKTLGTNDRVALIAGVLTANVPLLIGWSAASVPNSLGFFFFIVTIYFLLKSMISRDPRKYILLILVATAVSLLTHALTGIAAFTMVLLAFGIQKYYSWRHTHHATASSFLVLSFIFCIMLVPAASVLLYLIYPTYSSFSLQNIFNYDVYSIVLANYADYTTVETLIYGTTVFLAIIGIIIHDRHSDRKKLNLFMILGFIYILAEYRVNVYFSTRPLFGLHRILTFEPFITAPFAAITIDYLITAAKPVSSTSVNPISSKYLAGFRAKFHFKQALIIVLVCLGLSALIVEGDLVNFRSLGFAREPYGISSIYSTEAARLIHEEYLATGEKYAVVSDFVSEGAGMGFVGRYNPDEFYLYRYENLPIFTSLLTDMSIEILLNATRYNDASLIYVIVSRYSVARYLGPNADFDEVAYNLNRLLERFAVVGTGYRQVHVYRFRAERAQGIGPSVRIYRDTQEAQLNTTYSYWTLENVEYALNLTGGTSYNIMNWPEHWSYEEISPSPNSIIIDANRWINFTGEADIVYTTKWAANDFYPTVTWKDDSFLDGWKFHSAKGDYSFSTDGDVANQTVRGIQRGYVYHRKDLPSLNGSLDLQMRVKGELDSVFYVLLWDNSTGIRELVFNSGRKTVSPNYETYRFTLPANVVFTQIWIASYTDDGFPSIINWDYIMFTQG